ncbi:TPA: thiamine biosynthesis protein, partial [Legionella pneumophila]
HLKIIDEHFDISQCYTNRFLPDTPYSDLKPIACCLEN